MPKKKDNKSKKKTPRKGTANSQNNNEFKEANLESKESIE